MKVNIMTSTTKAIPLHQRQIAAGAGSDAGCVHVAEIISFSFFALIPSRLFRLLKVCESCRWRLSRKSRRASRRQLADDRDGSNTAMSRPDDWFRRYQPPQARQFRFPA